MPNSDEAAPLPSRSKKGAQTDLQAEVTQEIAHLIGRQAFQDLDLEAPEMAARQNVLRFAARAIARWLNADTSDCAGPHLPCSRGAAARYAGRRKKSFQTALRPLELERAYYHCPHCQHGFYPRGGSLGVENTSSSPAVSRMIAAVGAPVSFQEGGDLLRELAGPSVDAKQVERIAEQLGQEVADDERTNLEPMTDDDLPRTPYLGLDGTGIPMRHSELLGRAGKQPDGSSETREVKLSTIWSAESCNAEGVPVRDVGSVTYSAAIESAASTTAGRSEFTERVPRETSRRRFAQASRTVVIGDGSPWIWYIAQELFPSAVQIVDRFHAKEHLSAVAQAVYGATNPRAAEWAKRRHAELDDGRPDALPQALRRHAPSWGEARKCTGYIRNNRLRMPYPDFRRQKLCTSSGVAEAGCNVVLGTRLKRAGMH
jgi:hypothetical protein